MPQQIGERPVQPSKRIAARSWPTAPATPYPARVSVNPGLSAEVELLVGEDDTAIALQSGSVPVLATPRVVALCEQASVRALQNQLGPRETSVGMKVQLDHLAPTGIGHKVVASSTVEKVNGHRVTFTVSVSDERGLIAVGRVTRAIVDLDRFLEKVNS